MATAKRKRWTLEEFLAFDDGTDTRYELFDGELVTMAPPADRHGALVIRLGRMIGNALKAPCEVVGEAGVLVPERADTWYQADLAVTCAGLSGGPQVREPRVIIEVLSPSTARSDRNRKVPDYRTIPSVKDILVVSSSEARVEHLCRDGEVWRLRDVIGEGTVRLSGVEVTLDIGALYAGLDFAEGSPEGSAPTS